MSSYSQLIEDLKYELHELRNLRDSQPDGSSQFEHFQEQAQGKADELILLEANESSLCKLDNELEASRQSAATARKEFARKVHVWKMATLVSATVGVAVIGASVLLGFWLPVLLGLFALAGAAAAGFQWFRSEETAVDVRSRADASRQSAATARKEFARKVLPTGARP